MNSDDANRTDEAIVPDDKDWTWTLERACPDCGFAPSEVAEDQIAPLIRASAAPWAQILAAPGVAERPDPGIWSPLEYGAHVRDVYRLFASRTQLMLEQDAPVFENWDQDATAIAERYGEQDPAQVAADLAVAAEQYASVYDGVSGEMWERSGVRSNGSTFTVRTLGQYGLHDLVHHLTDVGASLGSDS